MTVAKDAMKMASYVKNLVNVERKEFMQPIMAAQYDSTGGNTAFGLCYPSQGLLSVNNRIGDSIKLHELSIRGDLSLGSAAYSQLRIIIFKGKHEDNRTYTIANDILENNGTAVTAYNYFLSGKKIDERFNTKFLHDKVYTLTNNKPIIPFHLKIKLGWHLNFVRGTTNVMDGGLYMIFISNQPTAANAPVVNFTAFTSFTDD